MTDAPALVARGLDVVLGERMVLRGVGLRVAHGEIAIVEGPSGSGKSTLLRALARLTPIAAGTISIDGAPADALSSTAYRVRVAYVPQRPVMFAGTVADNVRAGPRLRGIELADARVTELLAHAAIDPALASRSARELSGGEQQRVVLARAIANEPGVILFDEPTASLDPASASEVLALIARSAADGRGVVVVTHARAQAEVLVASGVPAKRYVCDHGTLEALT